MYELSPNYRIDPKYSDTFTIRNNSILLPVDELNSAGWEHVDSDLQHLIYSEFTLFLQTSHLGYKTFFVLNIAKHENFSANKYKNANNSWHFHIY